MATCQKSTSSTGVTRKDNTGVVAKTSDMRSSSSKSVGQNPSGTLKGSQKVTNRAGSGNEHPATSKKGRESVMQDCIQAAVIDKADPDGRISVEQWRQIEHMLIEEIALMRYHSEAQTG